VLALSYAHQALRVPAVDLEPTVRHPRECAPVLTSPRAFTV
jgi:hypothetical protein